MLRHGAADNNIPMRSDGFVKYSDLKKHKQFKSLTLEMLKEIVATDKKSRYTIIEENGEVLVRANQGHSDAVGALIKDEELMTEIKEPMTCIHATYEKFLDSIMANGLNRMKRKHIHCAASLNAKSGKRADCNVFIYINMAAAMSDGITFFRSDNDVILTSGIDGILPSKYFEKVERINSK